jgi:hypothetical protein
VRYLDDLRFIIGVVFAIMGLLVLFATPAFKPPLPGAINANLVGGVAMTAFAALMLGLAFLSPPKDQ